jgi:2-methylcitrate dehydratase PrpD
MGSADVVALRRRIEFVGDDELQRLLPSRQGIVELTLKDGRALRHHTTDVRGTTENPMTRQEVDEKAYALMTPVLGEDRARRLCDSVWALEDVPDMRELRPLLTV